MSSQQPPRLSRLPFGKQTNGRQSFPRAPSSIEATNPKGGSRGKNGDTNPSASQLPAKSNTSGKVVRFGASIDKENNGRERASTDGAADAKQTSGLAAFRQSVRDTISPRRDYVSTPTMKAPITSATPTRPPIADKNPVPTPFPVVQTPNSLLKSEMELSVGEVRSAAEESLLCSPEPSQASRRVRFIAVKAAGRSPTIALRRREERSTPLAKGMNTPEISGTAVPTGITSGTGKHPLVEELTSNATFTKKQLSIAIPPLPSVPGRGHPDVGHPPKATVAKKQLSVLIPPLPSIHGTSDRHQLIQDCQVGHHIDSPSPVSTPGGICLDLTNMFCNVASVSKNRPQLSCTSTTDHPWKRPPLASSQKPWKAVAAAAAAAATPSEEVSMGTTTASQSDEWIEKQCETFTHWLNYVVQPPNAHEESKSDALSALRMLQAHQYMAATRLKALQLFERMAGPRQILLQEIQRGRLTLRKDQNIVANLTLRQKMIELLMQYSTPWLRLGLETLFGQPILPDHPHYVESPSPSTAEECRHRKDQKPVPASSLKQVLKRFIVQRVLSDEATLAKYTKGKCAVPSGKFEVQYQAELRSLVLYRLMVLFFFLDAAKLEHLIPDVTLFRRESSLKSSVDVLLAFCRDFLSAEGNLIKHLARVGLSVSYQQERLDEVDFNILNLASDLRDGVRLTKVVEVLTKAPTKSLLSKLRVPATSRLQKLYNVGVALDQARRTLGAVDGSFTIAPHHIVDGHREMVLKLLWWLVAQSSLEQLVSLDQLKTETERLEQLYRNPPPDDLLSVDVMKVTPKQQEKLKHLLLRWCRAVVGTFGLEVSNMTTDFADGKALCYLISFYHPLLLRKRDVKRTTRDLPNCASDDERSQALLRERSNALLANSRLGDLGGIPKMVPMCDSLCPPDERSILLCLSFMWSRLMESKGQIRSSVIIQTCYRKHRARILVHRKRAAAITILRVWRRQKDLYYSAQAFRYGAAVQVIERFVLLRWPRLVELREKRLSREKRHFAATTIQKFARRALCKMHYSELLAKEIAAISFQRLWRCSTARRASQFQLLCCHSCRIIQRAWRLYHRSERTRDKAATTIQRVWRGFWALVLYNIDLMDIIAVQSFARRFLAIRESRQRREAVVTVQRCVSKLRTRVILRHQKQETAAILCQSAIRGMLSRNLFQITRRLVAVTKVQSFWRCHFKQRQFLRSKKAVILLQALFRQRSARHFFAQARTGTIQLQSVWRQIRAHRAFRKAMQLKKESERKKNVEMTQHIILMQSFARRLLVQMKIQKMQHFSCRIQATYRGRLQRRGFVCCLEAIVCLQAFFRQLAALKVYRQTRRRVKLMQSIVRGFYAKRVAASRRVSVIKIQREVRRKLSSSVRRSRRQEQLRRFNALVTIQRYWRGFRALRRFRSAAVIQAAFRSWNAQKEARSRWSSVLRLQTIVRRKIAQDYIAQLRVSKDVELRHKADSATAIQRSYRGYLVRREILCLHACALIIQRNVRCFMTWINYQMDRVDIILVQTLVRKWKAERSFAKKRLSASLLQAVWRGRKARRIASQLLIAQLEQRREATAAILLQSAFRGALGRRKALREAAARLLQKTWRCFTVHVDYILKLLASVKIQALARSFLCRSRFLLLKGSVLKINSVGRGFLCRLNLKRYTLAARVVQKCYRGYSAKSDYLLLRAAAIVVQCAIRGQLIRSRTTRQIVSATNIQKIWRGYTAFREYVWIIVGAIKIQSMVRTMLASVLTRRIRLEALSMRLHRARCSALIQRRFRVYLKRKRHEDASRLIQGLVRSFLRRLRVARYHQKVVLCQSRARGWRVRHCRPFSVSDQALRILEANSNAKLEPKQRLGNRTKDALHSLLRMKRLSELHAAICTLEIATSLSKECCQMFIDAGASNIFFSLIRTCNRSLPHIQLLNNMLRTLWNVSRHDHFVASIATTIAVEVFLDLIQMFRDKDEIFYLSSKLLEAVLLFNGQLESICRTQENLRRLNGVLHVHLRKTAKPGPRRLSNARDSLFLIEQLNHNESGHLCHGIRALQRVVHMVSSKQ